MEVTGDSTDEMVVQTHRPGEREMYSEGAGPASGAELRVEDGVSYDVDVPDGVVLVQ